ncbi:MAG: hypothetical protein D6731_25910, partial [Planctomycetota bacterium]
GFMALPWSKGVEEFAVDGLEELAEAGLWAQLPLRLRRKRKAADWEAVRGSPSASESRIAGVSAPNRPVRIVSLVRRGRRVEVGYTVGRPAPHSANVHLVRVPQFARVRFRRLDPDSPESPGLAGRLERPTEREDSVHVGICHSYDCTAVEEIDLPQALWKDLDALFSPPSRDAAQERERVSLAVALFERAVGPLAGTAEDKGGWKGNFEGAGTPGQQDCLDESANTTTLLGLLLRRGHLRFHRPLGTQHRGFFASHYSASMRERRSGVVYVVDSWFRDNGRPAVVQPLADWKAKRSLPPPPPWPAPRAGSAVDRALGAE